MSEEAIREAVLLETLSRLLREKIGAGGVAGPVYYTRRDLKVISNFCYLQS